MSASDAVPDDAAPAISEYMNVSVNRVERDRAMVLGEFEAVARLNAQLTAQLAAAQGEVERYRSRRVVRATDGLGRIVRKLGPRG